MRQHKQIWAQLWTDFGVYTKSTIYYSLEDPLQTYVKDVLWLSLQNKLFDLEKNSRRWILDETL